MEPTNPNSNNYSMPSMADITNAYKEFKENSDLASGEGSEAMEASRIQSRSVEMLAKIGLEAYSPDDYSKKELNLGDLDLFDDYIKANESLLLQEENSDSLNMIKEIYSSMKAEASTLPEGELKEAVKEDLDKLTGLLQQKSFADKILNN